MLKKTQIAAILFFIPVLSLYAQTTFTRDTTGAIVHDVGSSKVGSWGDCNNDGYLDLFITNGFSLTPENNWGYRTENCDLYINNGNPVPANVGFTPITSGDIVNDSGQSFGSCWGDYDNDGDLDLFVSTWGAGPDNVLYQNNVHPEGSGQVSFTHHSFSGGMAFGNCWGDYNNDGYLDLFVANHSINQLFQNNGDSDPANVGLTQISVGTVVHDHGISICANWVDYDNDGDLDLFVTNFLNANNLLYQNNDDGSFAKVTTGDIVNDGGHSWGSSWGDYDNDGDLDLFVANTNQNNFLYQNNGDGSFARITSGPIVNDDERSFCGSWGDYDNDGDLDLFVANGLRTAGPTNNVLYQNDDTTGAGGQVTFTPITTGDIVNDYGNSFHSSWADYDNDGDLDLFVANHDETNFLYKNDGNSNNWINIKCVGTFSNTSAIGVRVRVKATLDSKPVWQLREISAQTGQGGQNGLNAAFGLGDAAVIDSIKIEWTTGRTQILTNEPVNMFRTVIEPIPVNVQGPPISEAGTDIVVAATDTGNLISGMTLKYRRSRESAFTATSMSDLGNGSFEGTIPASEVTATGIEYLVMATDAAGATARLPVEGCYSVRVHAPDGISREEAQPHGSAQTAYRIFSVPLDLDNKDPGTLLEDDLGGYDDTRWRFLEYTGDNNYTEFPAIAEIVTGKGYWFIVSEPARFIDTGAGTSNLTSEEYAIALRSGWNLIGNPFNYPIPARNLRLGDGSSVALRAYDGSWTETHGPPDSILPFEGCAVYCETATTLLIDPYIHASVSSMAKRQDSVSEDEILWSVQVLAQCQQAKDSDNVVGVTLSASENWDQSDLPEPPPIGEYVSVYFPHQDWSKLSKRYCTDFRPAFSEGVSWEFEVQTNIKDVVDLVFDIDEKIPNEYEVWLVDKKLKISKDLRKDNTYSVAGRGADHPKTLTLVVGKSGYFEKGYADLQQVPTEYSLSQNYPNPFNPSTTIQYGLPHPGHVNVSVYDLLGREVRRLANSEVKEAGYHAVVWDGRSATGDMSASGVYIIRIQAGDFSQTRKMILMQ